MRNICDLKFVAIYLLLALGVPAIGSVYVRLGNYDLMRCAYGERGSLTATCVNATTTYFKSTSYRFDHLDETLRCLNCSLSTVETGSFDISGNQIKNLDLSNSLIETIKQKAFVGLIFLERLILANNDIKSIYPETFSGVRKIYYVNLENNSISILSDGGFKELVGLRELNIRNNHIKTIAEGAFKGLHSLQILDLSFNEINDVKDVFNNLTSLKLLDLSNNKIADLKSNEFDNLTSLLEVRFNFNHITQIPPLEFFAMEKLKRLDLSFNSIGKIIAGSFRGLYSLEDLDLSYNNIQTVPPKTFQSLHYLQNLNFSNNRLSIFQTGLYTGMPQLRVLNFSHNPIEDVEITGVFTLDSLDTLDFSSNNISYLDYVTLISRLPKLSYLKLTDNILPCDLEAEMENYFAEDNFKFIIASDDGSNTIMCTNSTSLPKPKHQNTSPEIREEGGSAANVWIFVLIGITLVLVCILYYLQLRTYQEIRANGNLGATRSTSQVQLISSELQARENEYLKE